MPLDMRQIPHYPNIGKNPYLFVRFDDVILDPDAYEPGDSVIDPRFIDPNYEYVSHQSSIVHVYLFLPLF